MTRGGAKHSTRQRRLPEAWLAAIEADGTALEEMTPIGREGALDEMLMMGLRLVEGVRRDRIEAVAGEKVETRFGARLGTLIDGGFVSLDGDRLTATGAGRQRLNAVLAALLG